MPLCMAGEARRTGFLDRVLRVVAEVELDVSALHAGLHGLQRVGEEEQVGLQEDRGEEHGVLVDEVVQAAQRVEGRLVHLSEEAVFSALLVHQLRDASFQPSDFLGQRQATGWSSGLASCERRMKDFFEITSYSFFFSLRWASTLSLRIFARSSFSLEKVVFLGSGTSAAGWLSGSRGCMGSFNQDRNYIIYWSKFSWL